MTWKKRQSADWKSVTQPPRQETKDQRYESTEKVRPISQWVELKLQRVSHRYNGGQTMRVWIQRRWIQAITNKDRIPRT